MLNGALKDALDTPSEGARLAAHKAAARAATQFDWLVADDAPLILSYSPRFVPPRRATGELTLAPNFECRAWSRAAGALRLDTPGGPAANQAVQAVPRYAPDFAAAGDDDPPLDRDRRVASGICRRAATGAVDRCVAGAGDGVAERLRFSVPRAAFVTRARTSFAAAALSIRRGSRTVLFQLLFTVLPDRPGSFAFDQLVRATTQESTPWCHPRSCRVRPRARPARSAAASIRRPAGASTRSVSAWSSSSAWAGRMTPAIRR